MIEELRDFKGGLDQDTSPTNYPVGKYFDCLNMRIISDDSLATSALHNIKGNSFLTFVPGVPEVTKVTVDTGTITLPGIPESINITINGILYIYNPPYTVDLQEFYQGIADFINANCIFSQTTGTIQVGNTYTINNYVPTDDFSNVADVVSGVINTTGCVFVAIGDPPNDWTNGSTLTYNTQKAYVQDDGKALLITSVNNQGLIVNIIFSSTTTTYTVVNQFMPSISFPTIIGWVSLREDIYLLTTDCIDLNPGGIDPDLPTDPDSLGQIWKLRYNKITKVPAINLIYNNYLNFTVQHPIANPGGIEARYETKDIEKIYWTDNFNHPRSLNVADPNVNALLPRTLSLTSIADHTTLICQEVQQAGGGLTTGIWELAYRLKNDGGATTTFSLPSNSVHITNINDGENYGATFYTDVSYQGSDIKTPTGKAIMYEIKFLDTTYDRVEIVSLLRQTLNSAPTINIIDDIPIPETGIIRGIFSGNEDKVPITLNEFNSPTIDLNSVKTIAQKNNRLFIGNVNRTVFDIDFDARTYRFPLTAANTPSNTTTVWTKNNVPTVITEGVWTLPNNHDAIQGYAPFTTPTTTGESQSPASWLNLLYQPTGLSGGVPVLGGAGPNISYTFTESNYLTNPYSLILDDTETMSNPQKAPYRQSSKYTKFFSLDPNSGLLYPSSTSYQDHHNPIISGLLRGYMRDEMYRFGIVFFDKQGNPGFAKWIADIRMPHMWMPNTASATAGDRISTCPSSGYDVSQHICYGYPMGVIFDIDISSIAEEDRNKISGFSIVRLQRTDDDKYILGQGSIFPVIDANPSTGTFYTMPDDVINPSYVGYTYRDGVTMHSPDFLFDSAPRLVTDDQFDVVALLEDDDSTNIADWDGGSVTGMNIVKNYSHRTTLNSIQDITAPASNNPYTITESYEFKPWVDNQNSFRDSNLIKIWNTSVNGNASGGGKCLYLHSGEWQTDFDGGGLRQYAIGDSYQANSRLYLANYKRATVANQYGGNSFVQRSDNEYIPCGNFVRVIDSTYTSFNDIALFGGDTFVTLFDNVHQFADTSATWDLNARFRGNIFPVETTINTELRQADKISGEENAGAGVMKFKYVLNKQSLPIDTAIGIGVNEEFTYNPVYSSEQVYKKFFAKPEPFFNNNEFDNRIYSSEVKVNGELGDSWGIFKEANYLDVDGTIGPINNLINLNNSLLFFQNKGIGKASIEERAAVATSSGDLTIGTSGVLSRFDYITREVGSKHQFGFTKNDISLWFFDVASKKIYELSGEGNNPVSDIKGLHSYLMNNLTGEILTNDNPYLNKGITCTYDYIHNEAIMTFKDTNNSFTLAYNIFTKSFTSFYSFTPSFYINDKYNIISPSSNRTSLYLHDTGPYTEFYGQPEPVKLSVLSNIHPTETKVLSNVEYLTSIIDPISNIEQNDVTWHEVRFRNNAQNTDFQAIDNLISRRRERTWNMAVPRDRVLNSTPNSDIFTDLAPTRILYGKKLRDKHFITDFIYTPVPFIADYKLIMYYIKFLYSISPR